MEGGGVKVVCVKYKKSDSGDKVKQRLLKKLKKIENSKKVTGVQLVPGVEAESVAQVAINSTYVVLLLKDGRVCRLRCAGNDDITESSAYHHAGGQSFQVTSDMEYARILQQQYNSERPSWSLVTPMDRDYSHAVRVDHVLPPSFYDPISLPSNRSITPPPSSIHLFPSPVEDEMELAAIDSSSLLRQRQYPNSLVDHNRNKRTPKSTSKLSMPKFDSLEWLLPTEQDTGTSGGFVAMAVMHSEILLVDRSAGQLYSWSCEQGVTIATPHPLIKELGLTGEHIVQLASSDVRATMVTRNNKMATFHDRLLQTAGSAGSTPSLVTLLTHPVQQLLGPAEIIKSLTVSDFYTGVVTTAGKVYWWGLSPQDISTSKGLAQSPVNMNKEKQKKMTIGCRVSVKSGPNYGVKMPVLQSSTTQGPRIGYTVDIDEQSLLDPKVSVKVRVGHCKDETASSKLSDSFDVPTSKPQSDRIEVWSRSQVVFLDNPTPNMGEVIAIDQQQAVVKLDTNGTDNASVKILKLSELEIVSSNNSKTESGPTLPEDNFASSSSNNTHSSGDSSSKHNTFTKHIAGVVQHKPLCLLDGGCQWKPADAVTIADTQMDSIVTGFQPISIHASKEGLVLLVERTSDHKVFLVFPATMTTGLVRGTSYVATGNSANYPNKCTLDEEAVNSIEAGLVTIDVEAMSEFTNDFYPKPTVGMKRKLSAETNYSDNELCRNNVFQPELALFADSQLLLVKNTHGFVSLLCGGSRLSPCANPTTGNHGDEISQPMSSIVISHRAVTNDYNSLVVAIVPRLQQIIPAILEGNVSHVQSILNHLNTSTGKGKGLAGKPGIGKKIKLSPEASPLASHDHQSGSHDHKQSSRDATTHPHILLERCTNNDTVLHMCCSASTGGDVSVDDQPHFAGVDVDGDSYQCITMRENMRDHSLEELRYNDLHCKGATPTPACRDPLRRSLSVPDRQMEILDILLNDSSTSVRSTINYLLCCRNQYGCTPFLHSIIKHNYNAALRIIEHVTSSLVSNTDDPMGEADTRPQHPVDFFEQAILTPCNKGMTPLHALFSSLARGVYDSQQMCLAVSGLPSAFTAQQLLKHFQSQYPSVYRAEVTPETIGNEYSDSEDDDSEQDDDVGYDGSKPPRRMSSPPLRGPGDTVVLPEAAPLLAAANVRRNRGRAAQRHRPINAHPFSGIFTRIGGTGLVYFSDVHQMRAAQVELDNTLVGTSSHTNDGGPFFGTSSAPNSSRIFLRLAGSKPQSRNTETSDSEDGGDDTDSVHDDNGSRPSSRGTISSAFNDLKKLHDMITASKRTNSSASAAKSTPKTSAEQKSALKLFNKLMDFSQVVTARDAGGETALSSLVHNPSCLKALKRFFTPKPAHGNTKKLPKTNPYRMTSLRSHRSRGGPRSHSPYDAPGCRKHFAPIALPTDAATNTDDMPSTGTTGGAASTSSASATPLNQPLDDTALVNMISQLVKKQIKEELSKDPSLQFKTPPDTGGDVTTSSTSSEGKQSTGKESKDDSVHAESSDAKTHTLIRAQPDCSTINLPQLPPLPRPLSPMFPGITGEGESTSVQEEKKSSSSNKPQGGFVSIMSSLVNNWTCIVATLLGKCVPCGETPGEVPCSETSTEYNAQAIDYFIQEMLYNCDHVAVESFTNLIITKLNEGFAASKWTLDEVLHLEHGSCIMTETNVALIVGMKYVHSLVRLLAVELSDSVIVGDGENGDRNNGNKNLTALLKKLLSKFSWLAVKCLADSAAATSTPVCLGMCKPLIAASVSSDRFLMRRSTMRPTMAPEHFGMDTTQQSSSRKKRVYVRQCYLTTMTSPKACLPPGGIQMMPTCSQEEIDELNSLEMDPNGSGENETNSSQTRSNDTFMPLSLASPVNTLNFSLVDHNYSEGLTEPLLASPGEYGESSTDDEEEYMQLIHQGVFRPDSEDDFPTIQRIARTFSVGHTTRTDDGEGRSAGEQDDIYPFAWALDGRNINENTSNTQQRPTTPLFGMPSEPISHMLYGLPSIRFGAGFLARTFCRLIKEMVDVAGAITSSPQYSSPEHCQDEQSKETKVMSLQLPETIRDGLVTAATTLMQPTWQWLVKVLDVAQGQLEQGQAFDTTSYVMSLRKRNHQGAMGMSRHFPSGGATAIGSTPAEYLTYLLRSHTGEEANCLPVLDLLGYEHVVYILDALMYSLSKWPKEVGTQPPTTTAAQTTVTTTTSEAAIEEDSNTGSPPTTQHPTTTTPSSTISRFFQRTQSITLNYNNEADESQLMASNSFNLSVAEEIPLAQQPHLLEPFLKKEEQTAAINSRRRQSGNVKLPLSFSKSANESSSNDQQCVISSWSVEDALQRWETVIKVFAHIFLAEGPGNERDNFLNPHAGFASRMARFRHRVAHYLETNASYRDRSWGGLSIGDSNVLNLRIRRSHLLQDSLQTLASFNRMHFTQVRVKFEGEDGSGPGVNRGFFAAVAMSLKNSIKEGVKVGVLLHEPGKKPEQSGLFSPSPVETCIPSRITNFRAIGRFLGLALLFRYNVPLMLCRHVAKYLIGRELSWHDVAFYNADLYEGLRRMIRDVESEKNSVEDFKATYCCYFEATHCGRVVELIPGGSRVAVTPDRVHEYVHLYATYKMVGCVQKELNSMKEGLHDVIPLDLLSGLAAEDFQLLLCGGSVNITMKRLKSIIRFQHAHSATRSTIEKFERMFWKVVSHMNNKQRQLLLYFATGSAGIPATSETEQGLTISVDVISGNLESLPVASTCGQRMSIPLYPSYHTLKKKLLQAIQCQAYGLS